MGTCEQVSRREDISALGPRHTMMNHSGGLGAIVDSRKRLCQFVAGRGCLIFVCCVLFVCFYLVGLSVGSLIWSWYTTLTDLSL